MSRIWFFGHLVWFSYKIRPWGILGSCCINHWWMFSSVRNRTGFFCALVDIFNVSRSAVKKCYLWDLNKIGFTGMACICSNQWNHFFKWQGVKLMIILKTAQHFLKTKFLSRQQNFLQKIAQWQMNHLINSFPYM